VSPSGASSQERCHVTHPSDSNPLHSILRTNLRMRSTKPGRRELAHAVVPRGGPV